MPEPLASGFIRRALCERPAMTPHSAPPPKPRAARTPLSAGHHAIFVVLGVIAVSLCFSLLRVVDVAVSGALHHAEAPVAEQASGRMPAAMVADDRSSGGDGCPMSAVLIEVPSASVEAIDL
jgi:hypothetical protein